MSILLTVTTIIGIHIVANKATSVTVQPDTINKYSDINVVIADDQRNISTEFSDGYRNGIVDNKWRINQKFYSSEMLGEWPLTMTLGADKYGFRAGQESSLTITMDGVCLSAQCDVFWAFSINDEEYVTFVNDFDDGWKQAANSPSSIGIFIYPKCGSSKQIQKGSPVGLPALGDFRNNMAGGDKYDWDKLSNKNNGAGNFPVTFEFINDDINNEFTVKFISSKFSNGLQCKYGSSVSNNKDFKLYLSPDNYQGGDLGVLVETFTIDSTNAPYCCAPNSKSKKWQVTCPIIDNEAQCVNQKRDSCKWIPCDAFGYCSYNYDGEKSHEKLMAKLCTVQNVSYCEIETFPQLGSCSWTTGSPPDEETESLLYGVYNNIDTRAGSMKSYGVYIGCFFIFLCIIVFYWCKHRIQDSNKAAKITQSYGAFDDCLTF